MSEQPFVVVGLLSGGKDSCYNLCHCAKLGHRVAALATLAPPQGKDELDSYMYQTVGHDAVHLIAEAMELPLYRTTITGQANNQTSTYGQRLASTSSLTLDSCDETEDLYTLLHMVKAAQPEVNAVSVGAILSNYQRVRVEHVALRLGIQFLPLSFLWQRDQAELLDEMCAAGLNSILIKVAGAGLEEVDLGKSLVEMRPKLHKLHSFYGAHICGEGGEYETLTLDCPLFKRQIVIDSTTTVVHSDSSFASVFYLRIDAAHLEAKDSGTAVLEAVATPPLLDRLGEATLLECSSAPVLSLPLSIPARKRLPTARCARVTRSGHWCAVANITGLASANLHDEFKSALDTLMEQVEKQSLSPAHLVHLNVYLSSQAHFPILNAVYRAYFGVDPPSRACVAIDLDEQSTCHVVIEATAFDDGVRYHTERSPSPTPAPRPRRALHVQGRSYWAAANIGPYSQSVDAHGRISISGQIGLLPATLQLASPPALEISLSLQHARRVFKATLEGRADKQRGWIEGCICWVDDLRWLSVAASAWRAQAGGSDEGDWSDDWLGAGLSIADIPITFILLPPGSLPRSAAVEWQLSAHDGRAAILPGGDDDDDDEGEAPPPIPASEQVGSFANFFASWASLSSLKGGSSMGVAHLKRTGCPAAPSQHLSSQLSSALQARVFYNAEEDVEKLQEHAQGQGQDLPAATTFIPVRACYDGQLQPCDMTIVWQSAGGDPY